MKIHHTEIAGLLLLEPKVYADERGYFMESYNQNTLQEAGLNMDFVQDNESLSEKGVLRGMHLQLPPYAQGKLVRVLQGAVLDVVVDLRKRSNTFGQWLSFELNEINKLQLWIPEGFAHGFLSLENKTILSYKCTQFYNKNAERCIKWDDKDLNITWNISDPILSNKDRLGQSFASFNSPF